MNPLKHRIVQRVFGITGANNLLAETIDSVERATLDVHRSNRFKRDLQYVTVQFEADEGIASSRVVSMPLGLRRIMELLIHNPVSAKVESATLLSHLTGYVNSQAPNKAVLLGRTLSVTAPFDFDQFVVGGLFLPDVSDDGYNSWIAEDHEPVITYAAAARVLTDLGDSSSVVNFQLAKSALDHLILDSDLVNT